MFENTNFTVAAETAAESINNCVKVTGLVIIVLLVEDVILWLVTQLILNKKLNIL